MNPLSPPPYVIPLPDYHTKFTKEFLDELTADINKYNKEKTASESQIKFFQLATKCKLPNKKINSILSEYYTDKRNNELNNKVNNERRVVTQSLSTEDYYVDNKYVRVISSWSQLNIEDINVLFLALHPVTKITQLHVEFLSREFTLQQCNNILKTNYKTYSDITYTQFRILKSDNKQFNLFSSDFPILSYQQYELGIQKSKLCPDMKMFYLKFYELMMLDIDGVPDNISNDCNTIKNALSLEEITNICNKYKQYITFRIYKSHNGYHIFITSERVNYDSERMVYISRLFCNDIFYVKFAAKNGYKIRMSPKLHRQEEFISKFICKIGDKEELPDLLDNLKMHDEYVDYFENLYSMNNISHNDLHNTSSKQNSSLIHLNSTLNIPDDLADKIFNKQTDELTDEETEQVNSAIINCNSPELYTNIITELTTFNSYQPIFYSHFLSLNFHLLQFLEENSDIKFIFHDLNNNKIRKYLLAISNDTDDEPSSTTSSNNSHTSSISKYERHPEFIRLLYISLTQYLTKPQRIIIDLLYYYVACDTYTRTYYICFKNLLMCDIDFYKDESGNAVNTQEIIDYATNYALTHNLTFRVYSSRNGFHLFLTSKQMDYKSEESFTIMTDMKTDFYYILYSKIRGWCVRLNRKDKDTNPTLYTYVTTIGNAPEDAILVELVDLHLILSNQFLHCPTSLIYSG